MITPNQPDGASPPPPLGLSTSALVLLTAALWGGTAVAIKYSVDTLPPVAVAAIRFGLAAVFLAGWCGLYRHRIGLRWDQVPAALTIGIMLFIQISLFNIGVHWSNASHGTLLINTYVIWVVAIEHFATKGDRMTLMKSSGLCLAGLGAALAVLLSARAPTLGVAGNAPSVVGDIALVVSAAVLGIKMVYTKASVHHVEPTVLMFWQHTIGTVLFVLYSYCYEPLSTLTWSAFTIPTILSLFYQGILVGGICFALQAILLRRHSATQISVFSFSTPLFGVMAAIIGRNEPLSPWLLMSGVCVAAGTYLVNRRATS